MHLTKDATNESVRIRWECSCVGSDESGTGGLMGGCSFAAFKLTSKNLNKLKKFSWFSKITDSKELTDEENIRISEEIQEKFEKGKDYFILNVKATTYNAIFTKNISKQNGTIKDASDKIKCFFHNWIHRELHEATTVHAIDDFLSKRNNKYEFYGSIHDMKIIPIDIFAQKGEHKLMSIAVASILARGNYLKNFEKLKKHLKIDKDLLTDEDNHNKLPKKFEYIFEQLEIQGISRDHIYSEYCKVDQLEKYKENLQNYKTHH